MRRHSIARSITLLLFLALFVAGCSGQQQAEETTQTTTGGSEAGPVATDAEPVTALSGRQQADAAAREWQQDARLYAIAAISPVDARGRSKEWSYTYVSESAGAVASVVVSGEGATTNPAQQVPEEDVQNISRHLVPSDRQMIDSDEAMLRAREVGDALRQDPQARASMGMDSFSSGEPEWIVTVPEQDIQERVPATSGGGGEST